MRRELRFGVRGLRRRPMLALMAWSIPEALPATVSGLAVARAVDAGFLAGRPAVGLAWLAVLMAAAGVGAVGARQVYRRLGDQVEPFRDELVRRVVAGALRNGVAGRADDGALARLTRQVEIVRDTYAGLLVVLRGFVMTSVGVVVGLLSIAPVVAALLLPPFLVGVGVFVATLGVAAARQRASVFADERLATAAGAVFAGARDVAGCGAEDHAAELVAGPIREQAAAELALARVAAMRTLCFAIGGWLPLILLLLAGPWLVDRGLTAGAIIGGLTYILVGLQPTLNTLMSGLGGSGLRFVVTLGRILDAAPPPDAAAPFAGARRRPAPFASARRRPAPFVGAGRRPAPFAKAPRPAAPAEPPGPVGSARHGLSVRGLTFAYGPHAEPVLRDLDLDVPHGDHLAIVGPSGIGKSTLAGLLCGLLRPDGGTVFLDGASAADLTGADLAARRVLIPQEAYIFTGTVHENLVYLRPAAGAATVRRAVAALGAEALVARLGGLSATLRPGDLSAGERQTLALVRAYLAEAPLAVLDEATCFLDPAAERRAEEAFAARSGTLVVIAHRISSALRARRVLVLDGVAATVGDHDAVRERSPLYRELLGHWDAGVQADAGVGARG